MGTDFLGKACISTALLKIKRDHTFPYDPSLHYFFAIIKPTIIPGINMIPIIPISGSDAAIAANTVTNAPNITGASKHATINNITPNKAFKNFISFTSYNICFLLLL
jgi:hypothetical protein